MCVRERERPSGAWGVGGACIIEGSFRWGGGTAADPLHAHCAFGVQHLASGIWHPHQDLQDFRPRPPQLETKTSTTGYRVDVYRELRRWTERRQGLLCVQKEGVQKEGKGCYVHRKKVYRKKARAAMCRERGYTETRQGLLCVQKEGVQKVGKGWYTALLSNADFGPNFDKESHKC